VVVESEIKKTYRKTRKKIESYWSIISDNKKNKIFVLIENWCANWIANHKGIFQIVTAVAIQNVFYLEMHQNNIFLFKKNYF